MAEGDDDWVVHPRWEAWVVDNLVEGAPPEQVVDALIESGAPAAIARRLVASLGGSRAVAHARRLSRRVRALEQIVRLRHEHRRAQAAGSTCIERRPTPPVEEFLARYWVPGVPVVLTDIVTRWPAFSRWTPEALAARLGDAPIEACVGREGVADPDPDWAPLRRRLTVRELMERITAARSNDVYVIAKNGALSRPELESLLDDIALPPEYFGRGMDPARMGLWIGPAGTRTPLHHDGDNAMLCQVMGRKRLGLAPPDSLALLDRSRGVYSRWEPGREASRDDERGPSPLIELELGAGEALFIPAGWWHCVDALEPSISVSIQQLAWANDYGWYRPGSALRGSHWGSDRG